MVSSSFSAFLLLCACAFFPSSAFITSFIKTSRSSFEVYGIGDFLSKALANEALPPPKNPGLSNGPSPIEVEFLPANKVVKAYLGQKIPDIAKANGITIRYSCKKGTFSPFQ